MPTNESEVKVQHPLWILRPDIANEVAFLPMEAERKMEQLAFVVMEPPRGTSCISIKHTIKPWRWYSRLQYRLICWRVKQMKMETFFPGMTIGVPTGEPYWKDLLGFAWAVIRRRA